MLSWWRSLGRRRWYVLGAGVAVLLGVILALVIVRRGRGGDAAIGPEGAATPDELAERGLAAMAAGDVDAYLPLTGTRTMQASLDCKLAEDAVQPDTRSVIALGLKKTRGLQFTIAAVAERSDPKPITVDAGQPAGNSCTLTRPLTMRYYTVKLAKGSAAPAVRMSATQVGDRFYLAEFGDLPDGPEWKSSDRAAVEELAEQLGEKHDQDLRAWAGTSPDGVAEKFVEAIGLRSRDRANAIVVRTRELEPLLDCDTGDNVYEKVGGTRKLVDDVAAGRRVRTLEVKAASVSDRGTADGVLHGCATRSPIEWADVRLELVVDGKALPASTAVMIKLADQWRVLYLDTELE